MRKENRLLNKANKSFKNEITIIGNRINILEQKALENFIEVMDVPEFQDEVRVDAANIILKKFGFQSSITKAFCVKLKVTKGPRKLVEEFYTNQISNNVINSSRKPKLRENTFHDK